MVRSVFRDQEIGFGSSLAVLVTFLVLIIGFVFSRIRKSGETSIEY